MLVSNWLETRDDEGTYDAEYHPLAIDVRRPELRQLRYRHPTAPYSRLNQ